METSTPQLPTWLTAHDYVLLGRGGTFAVPPGGFGGAIATPGDTVKHRRVWRVYYKLTGCQEHSWYAAPRGSEVELLNRPVVPPPEPPPEITDIDGRKFDSVLEMAMTLHQEAQDEMQKQIDYHAKAQRELWTALERISRRFSANRRAPSRAFDSLSKVDGIYFAADARRAEDALTLYNPDKLTECKQEPN